MQNEIILNIGLAQAAPGSTLPVFVVARALRAAGFTQTTGRIVQSDTEATYVTQGYGLSDHAIHLLAIDLEQECIAVYDLTHREGRMVGPLKEAWGEFNPAAFFLPNSSRMSEARSVA
jgi:hypothetical protein